METEFVSTERIFFPGPGMSQQRRLTFLSASGEVRDARGCREKYSRDELIEPTSWDFCSWQDLPEMASNENAAVL
jgi:hypothetical protein